jgi:hypothetical protein
VPRPAVGTVVGPLYQHGERPVDTHGTHGTHGTRTSVSTRCARLLPASKSSQRFPLLLVAGPGRDDEHCAGHWRVTRVATNRPAAAAASGSSASASHTNPHLAPPVAASSIARKVSRTGGEDHHHDYQTLPITRRRRIPKITRPDPTRSHSPPTPGSRSIAEHANGASDLRQQKPGTANWSGGGGGACGAEDTGDTD